MFFVVVFLCTKGKVFGRGQDNSRKCDHCNQTNHTIDGCWELRGKSFWPYRAIYLPDTAGSSTAHDSNTLGTSADEFVTIKI